VDWRDIAVYVVFMLTPFVTFPFILITAERHSYREPDET
jgi:hypothetical protein